MNAILNYPGAKWGMAKQIIALMPPHRSYLEPFFGSGAVLFNKPPSAIETVNDIDGDIVNFFRVLREQPEELARAISLTPYAREVYDDAHANRGSSEFDRAYRFAIRSQNGPRLQMPHQDRLQNRHVWPGARLLRGLLE